MLQARLGFSQEEVVTTSDGQRVILKSDHTWTYASEPVDTIAQDQADSQKPKDSPREEPSTQSEISKSSENLVTSVESMPQQYRSMIYMIGGVAILLLVVVSVLLIYFLIIQPRKKKKPLIEAYNILNQDIPEDQVKQLYSKTETLLEQAVANGLKKNDLSEANFALAYVRARLEKFEAAYVALENAGLDSQENAYLGLWLLIKLDKLKEAFQLYETYKVLLNKAFRTTDLASIAALKLGKKHWRNHEIETAIRYFDFVRELDVLSEMLPSSLSNYRITLGLAALFDSHLDEAREQFEKAVEQAKEENRSDIEAQIGLLLCTWREEKFPTIDDELSDVVEKIESEYPEDKRKVKQTPDADKKPDDEDGDEEEGKEEAETLTEEGKLVRNVLFWYGISRIYQWFHFKEKSGLPEEERNLLHERLKAVLEVDPEMGDARFIRGLIDYFFAYDTEREKAIDDIEKSDVHVPESDILVTKEKRLLEYEKKSLERYLALLTKYLEDSTVPYTLRQELKDYLNQFTRFKSMTDDFSVEDKSKETSASLQEIQARGELLRKRIDTIVKPRLKGDSQEESKKEFDDLLEVMVETSKTIVKASNDLETTEQKLMINTGEFLFSEEELAEDENPADETDSTSREGGSDESK